MAVERHRCGHCGRSFMSAAKAPTSCGRISCRAFATWGDDEWQGAARMARARRAAGATLTATDNEALRRHPQ